MGVTEASITQVERTPRKWCDTKSLVASGLAGWRADEVGDVAPGQCSRPVSALTCVAGNGGGGRPRGEAQGFPSPPGAPGGGGPGGGTRGKPRWRPGQGGARRGGAGAGGGGGARV